GSLLTPCRRSWHHRCSTVSSHLTGGTMERRHRSVAAGYWCVRSSLALAAVLVLASLAHAEGAAKVDSGDTAWMLTSSALVLMMTAPGLALFYGGLVRSKNTLSVVMQSFIMMALISVQWVLWGYSLAFGPDHGHVVGGLEWLGLRHVGLTPNADYAPTIPHQTYMIYQAMFAIITPALITGAFAERMKFSAFVVFSLLWATLVYDPLAHMVWGTGGLVGKVWGALDFAGGTVVHISSGTSALVCAIVIGKRLGFGGEPMPALVIGAVAGVLCYSACNLKAALGWYDDALDVVGVHGVGGTWGAIATGLWATARINPDVFAPKGPAVSEGLFISGQWGL